MKVFVVMRETNENGIKVRTIERLYLQKQKANDYIKMARNLDAPFIGGMVYQIIEMETNDDTEELYVSSIDAARKDTGEVYVDDLTTDAIIYSNNLFKDRVTVTHGNKYEGDEYTEVITVFKHKKPIDFEKRDEIKERIRSYISGSECNKEDDANIKKAILQIIYDELGGLYL